MMTRQDKTRQDKTRQDKTRQLSQTAQECQVVVLGNMDNTIDHTFESANRVYDKNQLCPTIPTCAGGNIQPKVIEESRCIGGLTDKQWGKQYHQQDRVYKGDIALAHPANLPEGSYKYIVAMRGRNPENPTDRTAGQPTKQRLEINMNGTTNTLTTVQKDNLVQEQDCKEVNDCKMLGMLGESGFEKVRRVDSTEALTPTISTKEDRIKILDDSECVEIKQATKEGSIKCKVGGCYDATMPDSKTRRGRVQEGGDVTLTLTAGGSENIRYVETIYRIRKLTPRECWRHMGYTDEDYDKASAVNSNTQLYKESGNAIVRQVLIALFLQMGIQGKKRWNEMTDKERYEIWSKK